MCGAPSRGSSPMSDLAERPSPFTPEQAEWLRAIIADAVAPVAAPRAVAATGRVPDVVDGEIIEAAWGNAIRDRSVPRYDTVAECKADTLSNVAVVKLATPPVGYTLAVRQ